LEVGFFLLDRGEFLRWIESAKRTLRSAEGDLERRDYNWTCFKAQQVAEMAVKALLHGLGLPAYGHSVSKLLSDLASREVSVSGDVMRSAKVLDRYYVPTRYPNAWAEGAPHEYYAEEDAVEALSHAGKVLEWVEEVWRYLDKGGE